MVLEGSINWSHYSSKGLDVIPSTLDLSGAEIELSSEPGREYILKELIEM
jgi:cellulose biosynthesis protein BcsQ